MSEKNNGSKTGFQNFNMRLFTWLGPFLLSIVGFFAYQTISILKSVQATQVEILEQQSEIRTDIYYLKLRARENSEDIRFLEREKKQEK